MTSQTTNIVRREFVSTWFDNTQNNHIAVPNIKNEKNCFKYFIHSPGFGKNSISLGKIAIRKYGNANPSPRNRKISIEKVLDCTNAYPNAAPMNGAVQGEATKTDKTPVKNEPDAPEVLLKFSSFVKLLPKSISVKRISPITNIKVLRKPTIIGDCN